jgi:hypothetical protein
MLLVVTPSTVQRNAALSPRKPPARFLNRGGMRAVPRGGPLTRIWWRMVLDLAFPRYMLALVPFPIAMLLRPDLALAISQAPLLMFGLVYMVEAYVLSIPSPEKRRALIAEAEAERGLDRLRGRGEAILTTIATGRGLTTGTLHLVVEQSALARVTPLTLVSVQEHGDRVSVLDLTAAEMALIRETLFDDAMDERLLQTINQAEKTFLRDTPLDLRSISAHARLMAMAGD